MKLRAFLQTCPACPAQWDAVTDDGRAVYVRHRHGRLQVRVGKAGDTGTLAGVRGDVVLEIEGAAFGSGLLGYLGDQYAGCMSTAELFEILRGRGFDVDGDAFEIDAAGYEKWMDHEQEK